MNWIYGLVSFDSDEGKRNLQLCEIYFKKGKAWMCCPISWADISSKKRVQMIMDDLSHQFMAKKRFHWDGEMKEWEVKNP